MNEVTLETNMLNASSGTCLQRKAFVSSFSAVDLRQTPLGAKTSALVETCLCSDEFRKEDGFKSSIIVEDIFEKNKSKMTLRQPR